MLTISLWTLGISTVAFMVTGLITSIEERRGSRLVLVGARGWCDALITSIAHRLHLVCTYVTKYIITLSWYYGLHSLLKLTLRFLAYTYTRIENVLIRNRARAKQIRKERRTSSSSHLMAIAEHKVETSLTPKEQKKLRDKTLAGTH